jgi:phosphatidate cytidylyltransferase
MLKTRVLTAVVLLAGFLSALFLLPRSGWIAFCALFVGLSAWEWGALAALAAVGRLIYSAFLVGVFVLLGFHEASVTNSSYGPAWAYYAAGLFWIALVPMWIWRQPRFGSRAVLLAAGATVLPPAAAALVDLRGDHPSLLLATLATVWISDTAAYFVGRRFGKRKLAPSISPGKTWEGVAGALAAVGLYALAWLYLGRSGGWPGGARAAAAWIFPVLLGLAVVGMIGDLFESLIKRQAGVKDSGTFLPGHGGILDRIDAPMAMLPLAVLVFMR